jgi:hypothetical protein
VAVGYVKVGRDRPEKDPDLRVREAMGLVFSRFSEMQSIRRERLPPMVRSRASRTVVLAESPGPMMALIPGLGDQSRLEIPRKFRIETCLTKAIKAAELCGQLHTP